MTPENDLVVPGSGGDYILATPGVASIAALATTATIDLNIEPDTKYENVNNYLKKIINSKETIYQTEDFYILALTTEIGINYFLIYKNFYTRQEAQDYCSKYLSKIESCLIVDTTKF